MSQPYVGEIRCSGQFAPAGGHFARARRAISDSTLFLNLIATTYGGVDSHVRLPDLQGRSHAPRPRAGLSNRTPSPSKAAQRP